MDTAKGKTRPKNSRLFLVQETLHFRYLKLLVINLRIEELVILVKMSQKKQNNTNLNLH